MLEKTLRVTGLIFGNLWPRSQEKTKTELPETITYGQKRATTIEDKAELLLNFFSEKVEKICKESKVNKTF